MQSGRTLTPLRIALRADGRRQDWLADRLGVDEAQVSRWVRGVHEPVEDTKLAIARLLGRPVDELWPGQGQASDHNPADPNATRLDAAA